MSGDGYSEQIALRIATLEREVLDKKAAGDQSVDYLERELIVTMILADIALSVRCLAMRNG